ncbi:50S ribosomal protein L11 methyltransferase [Estrella lausannensis]|uniref:Putative ribosomal protein L11 methyltransferase n=1 Tax=Estrella lausannensis TaxID=483423 RepID=A0A0H5DN19_9BACT|nr:50S ribosomal protein L11 methyltransferase [Estrella lausannensis]CRX37447.1 Putative ribosomal protein L11 methyltransferase [Estrella lausannensis]
MERFLRVVGMDGKRFSDLEKQLLSIDVQPLWISESESGLEVGILSTQKAQEILKAMQLPFEELSSHTIDWDAQWASFAKGVAHEGVYEIEFSKLEIEAEGSFFLKAGPGFGDLSHPTTQLMMNLMVRYCRGNYCIDIGSGSGILTVAAMKLGASRVEACDIDEQAVVHTRENIALNHFEGKASVHLPEEMWKAVTASPPASPVILINMIESEQRQALPWNYLKKLPAFTLIASGLLKEDTRSYCNWIQSFGPRLQSTVDSGEWSALIFEFAAAKDNLESSESGFERL